MITAGGRAETLSGQSRHSVLCVWWQSQLEPLTIAEPWPPRCLCPAARQAEGGAELLLFFPFLIEESFQLMALAQRCGSTLCFLLSRICRLGFASSIFRRQLFPSAQVPPGFLLSSARREAGEDGEMGGGDWEQREQQRETNE